MSLLILLKVVHVLAAIVAVGSNVTYAFWLRRAGRERSQLLFALQSIRALDSRIANPAYIVLGITGPAMVLAGAFSFTQGWIIVSLVLYVGVAILGIAVFAPAVRRQVAEAEKDPTTPAYAAAATRTTQLGILTTAVAIVIVVLMVAKPF
jgi:uncharacterized membrane protein